MAAQEPQEAATGAQERLLDTYGRAIRSLRFALTDRCPLNCIYCHREGDSRPKQEWEEISPELAIAIARVASEHFGIRKIKITGGEPLVRRDLAEIIRGMRPFEDDISITTNGVLLQECAAELVDAGLDRVNVSLDTLQEDRYEFITRTKHNLPRVIAGIHRAIDLGLTPIKLNMVLLKGINDNEISDMMRFVRACNERSRGNVVILQPIELIPSFNPPLERFKADFRMLEDELKSKAASIKTRRMQRRKKYFIDGVEVEVVHPIDNTEFCANCSRLRVTSDGKLKPCLLRDDNLVPVESTDEAHILNQLRLAMRYREPYFR
jgi:cyclic pyranopterin phosphate synthase